MAIYRKIQVYWLFFPKRDQESTFWSFCKYFAKSLNFRKIQVQFLAEVDKNLKKKHSLNSRRSLRLHIHIGYEVLTKQSSEE